MPVDEDDTASVSAAFAWEMADMLDHASRPSAVGTVPLIGWILIGASVVTLVLTAALRGLISTTPDIHPAAVFDTIESAAAFALAAALVIGAGHWARGRPRLLTGAVAFAIAGILQLAYRFWLAAWETDPRVLTGLETAALFARAFLEAGAMAAGFGLVALGLWQSRPRRVTEGRDGMRAVVVIGVATVIALAGAIAVGAREISAGSGSAVGGTQLWLLATVSLATAFLAIAASRYRPIGHHLPELAIGVGAFTIVVMTGVRQWALAITLGEGLSLQTSEIAFGVPMLLSAIGLVLLVIGFASGRPRSSAPNRAGEVS
ncbi:MAG: hypothetical protein ACR2K4_06220 [Candidatus Limnocylindria bacterium]